MPATPARARFGAARAPRAWPRAVAPCCRLDLAPSTASRRGRRGRCRLRRGLRCRMGVAPWPAARFGGGLRRPRLGCLRRRVAGLGRRGRALAVFLRRSPLGGSRPAHGRALHEHPADVRTGLPRSGGPGRTARRTGRGTPGTSRWTGRPRRVSAIWRMNASPRPITPAGGVMSSPALSASSNALRSASIDAVREPRVDDDGDLSRAGTARGTRALLRRAAASSARCDLGRDVRSVDDDVVDTSCQQVNHLRARPGGCSNRSRHLNRPDACVSLDCNVQQRATRLRCAQVARGVTA